MLLFYKSVNTTNLVKFPELFWQEPHSEGWEKLCNQLQEYKPPPVTLRVKHPERKWEVVSAYQKCVRRGLNDVAQRLVGAFLSFDPKEYSYFWRRICTTACEDVGYANPELMNFAIACSMEYGSVKVPKETKHHVWSFLTQKMCESLRSRVYCQLSFIEGLIKAGITPPPEDLEPWEIQLVETLSKARQEPNLPKFQWTRKNNWRGEGMLDFQGLQLGAKELVAEAYVAAPAETLSGLPAFAYDMHTRVGKTVTFRLAGKLKNLITDIETENSCKFNDRAKAIGWSLFLIEGGVISSPVWIPQLSNLEKKFVAAKFDVSIIAFDKLIILVMHELVTGVINDIRVQEILKQKYL